MAKFFTRPPLGTPLNPAHRLNHGLVGYWGFGEGAGSKTQDLSGKGNHGTLTNMVQGATSGFTGGKFGGAMNFDGVDDSINAGDITALNNISEFTFQGWFLQNILDVKGGMFIKAVDTNNLIRARTWTDGNMYLYVYNGSSAYAAFDYSLAVKAKTWFHFALVFKGGGSDNAGRLKVYFDGVERTLSFAGTMPANVSLSGSDLEISDDTLVSGDSAGNAGVSWNGSISEVRIYNRALSAQEVQQLYTDPFCMYERENKFRWFLPPKRGSFFFSKK